MGGLLVCSHRGPVSFNRGEGGIRLEPAGPGGLVVGVVPAAERFGGTWLFASSSPEEAEAARQAPAGLRQGGITYRLLDLPPTAHHDHYATISTELLMSLFHYLLPLAERPAFDQHFYRAWDNYRLVNSIYADAILDHPGDEPVLVEDLHLMLVAAAARSAMPGGQPKAPLSYFHHVPWCGPDYFGVLPGPVRTEILAGLLAFDSVGFHCRRWLDAFWACCERFLPGISRAGDIISWEGRRIRLVASRVAVDIGQIAQAVASPDTLGWQRRFASICGGRKPIVRVERADPAKNTVRGIEAYAALLQRRPSLAEQTCLLAVLTPVRTWSPEYRRYLEQCQAAAARINEMFQSHPVCLHLGADAHSYDRHRALAALSLAHAVMVTSVYDGCNLVAMEAMAAGGQPSLVLSENTGAHAWFGQHAFSVNPFDVTGTSHAIERAVDEEAASRAGRAAALRDMVAGHRPEQWIRDRFHGLW
jgi:trehalose 6-phosphate synthase